MPCSQQCIAHTMSADAWPEVQSTKLDAARRQLETAISLLFSGGDANPSFSIRP